METNVLIGDPQTFYSEWNKNTSSAETLNVKQKHLIIITKHLVEEALLLCPLRGGPSYNIWKPPGPEGNRWRLWRTCGDQEGSSRGFEGTRWILEDLRRPDIGGVEGILSCLGLKEDTSCLTVLDLLCWMEMF